MNEVLIGVCVASFILSCVALIASCAAITYLVGLKNSTHQVVDLGGSTGDDLAKEFEKILDEEQKGGHL